MARNVLFLVSTFVLLCHCVSLRTLLLAQVHQPSSDPANIVIKADSQQKTGARYLLEGHVEITDGATQLQADRVEYDDVTGEIIADGNVHFFRPAEQEDLHAARAEYNHRSGIGKFLNVQGSVGAQLRNDATLLISTNPFFFTAERVDRNEKELVIWNAEVTVCTVPDPTWSFNARKTVVEPGLSARVYHGTFRVLKVPLIYVPFFYRSLRPISRSTGFLMPAVGNNSRLGTVIGESFFWAINRSADLEIGGELLSKRGWSQQATFRIRPNAGSYLNVSYYGVVDRGFGPQKVDQGGRTARVEGIANFGRGFRGLLDANYLSSLTFREAFSQSYRDAVNSEAHTTGSLTKTFNSFRFDAAFSRFENFQSIQPGDKIRIDRLPELTFDSVDRPVWHDSPLWISWNSSAGAVSRTEPFRSAGPILRSDTLERLIFAPEITVPMRWKNFHVTPVLGVRGIRYGKQQRDGEAIGQALNRGLAELSVDIGPPPLTRTFAGGLLAPRSFQHRIEPKVTLRNVAGSNDFSSVLLFDEHDRVTNTRELDYSITNRLFIPQADGGIPKEIFSWELRQKYYFDPQFGSAVISGQRNVFASTLDLSAAAFIDAPRRFSPIMSLIRLVAAPNYELEFREDYDTMQHRFTHGALVGNLRRGNAFASVSHFFVRSSPVLSAPSNQIGFSVGYGSTNRVGWNGVFAGAYNVRDAFLQFSAIQVSYNNDCCGISFEYRRFALGPVRNENQFRMAFSLANVGTFGNLKKQERLF